MSEIGVEISGGEKEHELRNFVDSGIDLIREERLGEAIGFFRNDEMANKMGFELSVASIKPLSRTPKPDEIDAIFDRLSFHPKFVQEDPPLLVVVDLEGARYVEGNEVKKVEIPEQITRYIALTHAEEWLHGLQYIRKGAIAGYDDQEIDVANYIHQRGVPLTEFFLAQYDREKHDFLKVNPDVIK